MMRRLALAVALLSSSAFAVPTPFDVFSNQNSINGFNGVVTFGFTTGQNISVSVSATDIWSAGPLPRWSNADGLVTTLLATGTDESGFAAGTLIGQGFPSFTQFGYTAPYGSLVGRIGGVYQLLGTNFAGPAWATGNLELFYWDENAADNLDKITALIDFEPQAIPEPSALGLLGVGIAMLGFARRRKA
jgi:PEP-CTERM motif